MSKTPDEEAIPVSGPLGYRRSYRAVLAEAFGKAIVEESELHNNPNGDAGITNGGIFIRVLVKGIAYFMRQNSINLSKSSGEGWRALGPMDILMDKGTCGAYCEPGVNPGED